MSTGFSFSHYIEAQILNWILLQAAPTVPANLYVALFTAAPTDAGGGTEVTGGSYARQNIATIFTAPSILSSGSTSDNGTAITFPTPTGNWGTVVAVGIYDASAGGNLLLWGNLTTSQTINSGNQFSFPISNLSVLVD